MRTGRARARDTRQAGLTLPELLIALLIFSMVSAAGVAGLRLSIDGRDQFEAADARLRDWQTMQAIVRDDLANMSVRVPRDEFGTSALGPFVGGQNLEFGRAPAVEGETRLFAFVRNGRVNPDDVEPRSTLQYVEYLFRDAALIRRTRPYIDAAPRATTSERQLLGRLSRAEAGFLLGRTSRGLDWAAAWPPVAGAGGNAPRAVRLVVEDARYGELEVLFWVGAIGG